MKAIYIIGATVAGSVLLSSCKPTEENYKAAYDAAVNKRETENKDRTGQGVRIEAIDAPRRVTVSGVELGIKTLYLHSEENVTGIQPEYCLVVARYKMPTNARGQVAGLKESGYNNATVMSDSDQMYLVVADVAYSLEDAVRKVADYRKRYPEHTYVGLYGDILVIEKPR